MRFNELVEAFDLLGSQGVALFANSRGWQRLPTWVWERGFALVVLVATAAGSGGGLIGWASVAPVLLTFAYAQIASRLAEAEVVAVRPAVYVCRPIARSSTRS